MKSLLLLLAVVIQDCYLDSFLEKFHQHDYKIKNYRMETVRYDKKNFKILKFSSFKYNRTTTAHNGTLAFKEAVGRKLEIVFQGYKFLSNEYRKIQFRFQTNFCKGYDSNIFGSKVGASRCGNLTECDFHKDRVYHICNFLFDESKFPPLIPTGQYKFSMIAMYLDQDIGEINVYLEIYRPIYPKK